ncbi:MAG TPA: YecR family lipoprotein [Steroidobacteraceae bacterium]|nr:YecR family lipoprotein [Steroidobacteraceae bacterium]
MTPLKPSLKLLATAAMLLTLAACATSQKWAVSGGDRTDGVVRVSYEYPEFQQPSVTDEQAMKIALGRCAGWGFDEAEPIAGQIRQCSNMEGSNCNLWTVTREYQCTQAGAFASNFAR